MDLEVCLVSRSEYWDVMIMVFATLTLPSTATLTTHAITVLLHHSIRIEEIILVVYSAWRHIRDTPFVCCHSGDANSTSDHPPVLWFHWRTLVLTPALLLRKVPLSKVTDGTRSGCCQAGSLSYAICSLRGHPIKVLLLNALRLSEAINVLFLFVQERFTVLIKHAKDRLFVYYVNSWLSNPYIGPAGVYFYHLAERCLTVIRMERVTRRLIAKHLSTTVAHITLKRIADPTVIRWRLLLNLGSWAIFTERFFKFLRLVMNIN